MNLLIASIILLVGGSIKYVLFGSFKEFDNIFFHYTQFIVSNLFLLASHHNSILQIISGFSFWLFFGLSPYDNTDKTFEALFDYVNNDESKNNVTRRMLSNNTSVYNEFPNDVTEIITWINSSRFLLTLMIIFGVSIISFSSNVIMTGYSDDKCQCTCCRCDNHNNEPLQLSNTNNTGLFSKIRTSGYTSFFVKILLICYCNFSTIIIAQMLKFNAMSLVALVFFFIVVIGFPFFITRVLYLYSHLLYQTDFRKRWGSMYLLFKDDPFLNKFMVIVLAKQFIYSIIINISSELTIIQNSLLIITNFIFLLFVWRYKPYASKLYQLQAKLMGIISIIISIFNFAFLFDELIGDTKIIITSLSVILHLSNFLVFFVLTLIRLCTKEIKDESEQATELEKKADDFQQNVLKLSKSSIELSEISII